VAGFIGEPPMNFVRDTVKNGCIAMGDNTLDLRPKYADIGKYEGREIVFGFRPEAVRLGEADNACVVKCRVELTEMLGDNTNVYITAGDKQAILKVDSHDTPEMDADISFSIPLEDVYLFDAQTENVIV
jgi:multiple sugar transport system ATP-binding protein